MAVDTDISARPISSVRLLEVDEVDCFQWRLVRAMRLAALCDAPLAFVNTWAAEWRMPREYWQDRFTEATWVVARDREAPVGIARLAPDEREHDAPRTPYFVESVWVDRPYRWQGVLRQMMDRLEVHALALGATELRLWVLDTNEAAGRAYHKLGFSPMFVAQTTTKRAEDGTFVTERLMSKPLL